MALVPEGKPEISVWYVDRMTRMHAMSKTKADLDPRLLRILVCPITRAPLEYDPEAQELISRKAAVAYPTGDGIPVMLLDEARRMED